MERGECGTLTTPEPSDTVDPNMLGHAATIFRYFKRECEDMLPGLEGLLGHPHFKDMCWTDICGRVSGDLMQMILKALQLPDESTFEALHAFDGKLVCLCGHPGHRQPKNLVAKVPSAPNVVALADSLLWPLLSQSHTCRE